MTKPRNLEERFRLEQNNQEICKELLEVTGSQEGWKIPRLMQDAVNATNAKLFAQFLLKVTNLKVKTQRKFTPSDKS